MHTVEHAIKLFMHASGHDDITLSEEDMTGDLPGHELLVEDSPLGGKRFRLRRLRTPEEKIFDAAREYAMSPTEDNWTKLVAARNARPAPEKGSTTR